MATRMRKHNHNIGLLLTTLNLQRLWGLNDWGWCSSQSSISESSSSSSSESSVESVAPRGLEGGSAMSPMEVRELDTDNCSCGRGGGGIPNNVTTFFDIFTQVKIVYRSSKHEKTNHVVILKSGNIFLYSFWGTDAEMKMLASEISQDDFCC